MIKSGLMRERIDLQAPTDVRSLTGEATLSWATTATVWADVQGLSTRDLLQAQQANVIATHRMIIRFRDGVTNQYRVVWRGKTMEVASVTEHENRSKMVLLVREVA